MKYYIFGSCGFAFLWNPLIRGLYNSLDFPFLSLLLVVCAGLCGGLYFFTFSYQIFPQLYFLHLVYWNLTLGLCVPILSTLSFLFCPSQPFWLGQVSFAHMLLPALVERRAALSLIIFGNLLSFFIYLIFGTGFHSDHLLFLYPLVLTSILFFRCGKPPEVSNSSNADLELKLQSYLDFTEYVAHELRLPLQGIRGVADLLSQPMDNRTEQQKLHYLGVLRASCSQLINIASNVLDFAKFQSGYRSVNRQMCNFRELVNEVVYEFEALSLIQETEINVYCSEITVLVDITKVKHILRNLLANALRSTRCGKVGIQAFLVKDSTLHVSVSDTGHGTSKEKVESMLSLECKGYIDKGTASGLGLVLASQFVRLHGGRIWVEDNSPKGSVFLFTLALSENAALPSASDPRLKNYDGNVIFWPNVTESSYAFIRSWSRGINVPVVIVDDDKLSLLSSKLVMEELGFKVHAAQNCSEARRFLIAENAPLVLLDVVMARDNLNECIRDLQGASHSLNIILQSGIVPNHDLALKNRSVVAYLLKPYGVAEVRGVLEAIRDFGGC